MGTIEDKFKAVLASKQAQKEAIIKKGVPVSDTDTFASYADKIGEIPGEELWREFVNGRLTLEIIDETFAEVTNKITDGDFLFYMSKSKSVTAPFMSLTSANQMFGAAQTEEVYLDAPELLTAQYMCRGIFAKKIYIRAPKALDMSSLISHNDTVEELTCLVPGLVKADKLILGCSKLITIYLDVSSVESNLGIIYSCPKLTNLTIIGVIKVDRFSVATCNLLTVESCLSVLNALIDRTGQVSYQLYLGTTNINKLTDEQKAVAINKNWTLI